MKICHITSMHAWDNVRIFHRACIGLLVKGFEIHLIATSPENTQSDSGVQFHWLKKRKGIKRRIFSSREAYKLALKINADLFHFHDPDLLPWMLLLTLRKRKIIYDIHENYNERILTLKVPNWIKIFISKLWVSFERFCISKFAGIITTTQSMQDIFSNINVLKIIVSNSVYMSALHDINFRVEKIPFSVYSSGSHSDKRNCMQTILALPLILKKFPKTKLIFAGTFCPENYKDILMCKAKELGVDTHLEIQGMLSYRNNFNRTTKMEIGCVFYEDNVNNRVTIPNRLFEYMYAGVAVIGESFPEVRNVIEQADCGIIVNSSDPESIANAIIELFADIPKLRKMQLNARNRIKTTYAFEHDLESMVSLYNKIITEGQS